MDETYMHLITEHNNEPHLPPHTGMNWIRAYHERVVSCRLPDLDDPATLGCLLALVRQAYGRMMYVRWWDNPQPDMSGQSRARCEVVDTLGRNRLAGARTFYPSEAEALVAALEAAP